MDNVIKQGYLKKAKATPSNRTSVATQILQMLEPQRWYVLGLRSRRPYLEYYDKEEHVFSEQPINTYDLGRCQRLTYTLGRTNKNWTFCLFLQDRVIELTAESRSSMLDWCRVLERALHNYGCLKKYDGNHIYSEFPIKHVPTKSGEVENDSEISSVPTLSIQIDGDGGDEAAGSTETTPVNSPDIQQEEIIFGTQFSLMEAMIQDHPETAEESDQVGATGIDGVVYRRKSSLKPDGNTSEFDTSEDDFVTKDFWLNNKLPPVPKRNLAPPLPDRALSLVLPSQGEIGGIDAQEVTSVDDPLLLNVTSRKERNRKSHSAPIVPSSLQKSIPPIPPRNNKKKNSIKGGNSFQDTKENEKDIGGACGSSLATATDSKKSSIEDLDDGYQSIQECTGLGPKFVRSQGGEMKTSVSERCESDLYSKPKKSGELKSCDLQADALDEKRKINDYTNVPIQQQCATNVEHQSKTDETTKISDHKNAGVQQQRSTNNSQSKAVEENLYSAFPGSCDDNDTSYKNSCETVENTVVKNIDSGNANQGGSKNLLDSFRSDFDDCFATKNNMSNVSDRKIQPDIPPLETTIPKITSPSISGDIVCPPRKTVNPSSDATPSPPALDSLPSRKLSPDHTVKSFPPLPLPPPPSLETLPKRGLNNSNEHSQSLQRTISDPQSPPVPPSRKILNSNKFSSSLKSNISVIDVTNRPLPSLPTEEENKSPTIVITNGRTSPSLDDFKFDTGNKKSSSLSSNSSASDVDPMMGASADYEDATMRNQPPVIPPRLKKSLERKSQSVYVPSSSKDDVSDPSSRDEKDPKGILRQSSLQDRQRISRSSGAFTVVPLKHSQAELLKEEQALHGVGVTIHCKSGPRVALVDSFQGVWIAGWDFRLCPRLADRLHIGDEVIKINDTRILNSSQAYKIMKHEKADSFKFVVRRIPYGKVIAMRRCQEREPLGIHREGGTAVITYVDPSGLAAEAGLEKKAKCVQDAGMPCNWMLTEINNRPLNLSFKGNEIEHLLNAVGKDISVVVQPEEFVKALKKQLKKFKNYKDYLAPS